MSDWVTDEARLLAEILAELRRIRDLLAGPAAERRERSEPQKGILS